ncbi:MAG: hypothetical protein Q4F88_05550 [Eubacteriales bacterium]|nr:hypothetical protein [Eubacteriales bacterium]
MRKRQIKIYISILFFLFINIITYANSFIFTNNLNYNEKTNIILNISNDKKWSSAFYKMSSINIQKNENT